MTEKTDDKTVKVLEALAEIVRKKTAKVLDRYFKSKAYDPIWLEDFVYTPKKLNNEIRPTTCIRSDPTGALYSAFGGYYSSEDGPVEWFRFNFKAPTEFGEGRLLQTLVAYQVNSGLFEIFLANHDLPVVDVFDGMLRMHNIMADFNWITDHLLELLDMEERGGLPEWEKDFPADVTTLGWGMLRDTLVTLYVGDGKWNDEEDGNEDTPFAHLGKAKEKVDELLQYYACLSWFFHEGGGRNSEEAAPETEAAARVEETTPEVASVGDPNVESYKALLTLLLATKLQVAPEQAEYILKTCPTDALKKILMQ